MASKCERCGEIVEFLDSKTSSGAAVWHTCCWNEETAERAAFLAECDDSEGFSLRVLPDELMKSETGNPRSEVFQTMATQTNRTPREVVDFPANVPVTVALRYPHGKTIRNQYGERIMFSLVDGRVMFLDPEVGGQIEKLGINVRENFTVTRKSDGPNSPVFSWEVARAIGEQPNGTCVVPGLSPKPVAR